jgi:N-acetyl-anhydromuramyl-L-alanine amidase AmpD
VMRFASTFAVIGLSLAFAALPSCAADAPLEQSHEAGPQAKSFALAASTEGLPAELLLAIAVVEEGLTLPRKRTLAQEVEVPAAGPLMLRHGAFNSLARGAELQGVTEHALREDADLALAASAKVVAELGRKFGAKSDDVGSFKEALMELSGFSDEQHRRVYAAQVLRVVAQGGSFEGRDGEQIRIAPKAVPLGLQIADLGGLAPLALPEYPGAEVFPIPASKEAAKLTKGRGGAKVQYVVIHDTEGGWTGSVATLQNDPGKSVQYIIDKDGRTGQFMSEADTAYHTGNRFYNQRSIGIEHVGFKDKLFPEAQYAVSAKMVKALTSKYMIALDRVHIIGHNQIPDGTRIAQDAPACASSRATCDGSGNYGGASNHDDPGIWEWATYMPRFGGNAKCNDVTTLWKCSDVTQQAFRCPKGAGMADPVELRTCKAPCVKGGAGADDVCDPADAPVRADAGVSDASAPPLEPAKDAAAPVRDAAKVPSGPVLQEPATEASAGCSCVSSGQSPASGAGYLLVACLVLLTRCAQRRP